MKTRPTSMYSTRADFASQDRSRSHGRSNSVSAVGVAARSSGRASPSSVVRKKSMWKNPPLSPIKDVALSRRVYTPPNRRYVLETRATRGPARDANATKSVIHTIHDVK